MSRTARLGAVALAIVMMQGLIACGGSSDEASDSSDIDTPAASDNASDSGDSGDSGDSAESSGDLDCAAIQESLAATTTPLQIVAQLKTADQWDVLNDGVLAFDVEEFQAGVEGLRPLESLPENGAAVAEGLDVYAEAGALIAEAQQSPDPASTEANASLTALTEDVSTFLLYQADIGMALDEAGC